VARKENTGIDHGTHLEDSPWREGREADACVGDSAGLSGKFKLTAKVAKDSKNSNYKNLPIFFSAPFAIFAVQPEF
jgi:hypothetical protein